MKKLLARAKQIRQKYKQLEKKKYGRSWTAAEVAFEKTMDELEEN